jgi:8-oxo-dGTP pyrophosphatase MutT (NUDIX family)
METVIAAVPPSGRSTGGTQRAGTDDWADFPGARPSAVLIAVVDTPDGPAVLLTRRSGHLRNHRGEMSFPGGRLDEGEDPVSGALREAWEEIALPPSAVEPVGELSPLATFVSRSHIVPIVGRVRELPELRPNPDEVDRIMVVPLVDLAGPEVYRQEIWDVGAARPDGTYAIHFFELDDETVWGATGRMLVELLSLVLVRSSAD